MTESKRKEDMSIAYLQTVCAYAWVDMIMVRHDDDGTDCLLKKSLCIQNIRYDATISVQLKSTSQSVIETDTNLHYALKKKNYDDLRSIGSTSKYLFVLFLPNTESDWITHSCDELILRRCMYWHDLSKAPQKSNTSSVTLNLDKNKFVSPGSLIRLIENTAKEVLWL